LGGVAIYRFMPSQSPKFAVIDANALLDAQKARLLKEYRFDMTAGSIEAQIELYIRRAQAIVAQIASQEGFIVLDKAAIVSDPNNELADVTQAVRNALESQENR
jgi:hypothetical protein